MTLRQVLTTVNRIPELDIGRALTRPVTNPLLKAACGFILGIAVFGPGSMTVGLSPSDGTVRLLALALGLVFAAIPNSGSSARDTRGSTNRPAG